MRPKNFRDVVRQQLRDSLLNAAYERATSQGWDAMRMADVAADVGVSRQTVYNEFGSKGGLGEALVLRETERFLAGITRQLHDNRGGGDEAITGAIEFALREGADNSLLKAVLTSARGSDDSLLPLLTTRSEPVLHAASVMLVEFLLEEWPELDREDVELVVDALVRLTVSHLVLPIDPPDLTARRLTRLVQGFLPQP